MTHSTCREAPKRRKSRPTTSATAPPMPLSTSSKTSVGTGVIWAVITAMASEMRANSPPEATLVSGAGVAAHQKLARLKAP